MFFSNRVSTLPSDKSVYSYAPSSFFFNINISTDTRHHNNLSKISKKRKLTRRIYQRIFSRRSNNKHNNDTTSSSVKSTITPCLSTSTSASWSLDHSSSFSISKKMSSETQSSKSSEFEALIVDHPSRTVRVSLTPICAA